MLSLLSFLFDSTLPKGLILTLRLHLHGFHKTDEVWKTSNEFHLSSLSSLPLTFSNDKHNFNRANHCI